MPGQHTDAYGPDADPSNDADRPDTDLPEPHLPDDAEVASPLPELTLSRVDSAAALLRTLGAPVRLAVLVELLGGERCVHELVEHLYDAGRPVSQPLVSQHLRRLRLSGLVRTSRRGTEVLYALADDHVGHIVRDALRHAGHPAG